MKTLPLVKNWTGDGYGSNPIVLTQIKRNNKVALYSRRAQSSKTIQGYELFIVKVRCKGQALPGGGFEEEDREVYPSAQKFGKTAVFLAPDLEKALARFEQMSRSPEEIEADEALERANEIVPVVTVKPPKVNIPIPKKEFSMREYSEELGIPYHQVANWAKAMIGEGKLEVARQEHRSARGKPLNILRAV